MNSTEDLRASLTHRLVHDTAVCCGEPELDRTYLCDAVIVRERDHYRIEAGAETAAELERAERRRKGWCDCGAPLSISFRRRFCRRCDA